jgi:hypothetical protein
LYSLIELFQPFVLGGQAALARGVDHDQGLAPVLLELDPLAPEGVGFEGVDRRGFHDGVGRFSDE